MATATVIERNNATGHYTVRCTHTFSTSFATDLIINDNPNGYGRGTQIASGTGSQLTGTRDYEGTSYGSVSGSAVWYFWVKGQAWNRDSSASFSWTVPAAQFTVTFDPGEGTTPTAGKTVTYGETYGELPTPERSGYAFLGWFTEGGTEIKATDTVSITEDTTLYAHWEAMSILHVLENGEPKTVTEIWAAESGNPKKIIGVYAVVNGEVHQGV